ncbi:MAG: pyrroline-5-carboxylate reductase [Sphingomonadaceae bacterium]|nr:pyrroline-5-carboxylate reductase [Sphingomonadaceae bacterium]
MRLDRLGPLWVVGCGNMGGALLRRWLACGLEADSVTVIDPAPRGVAAEVSCVASVPVTGDPPQVVLLAIKPQMIVEVADRLRPRLGSALVVSILAGVEIATLHRLLSPRVVRAMPNMPAQIGQGTTALYGGLADDRATADALMQAVGAVHWIEDEHLFDAVTGVSGSGPAYLFRFIEALAAAGAAAGLPAATASALALETITGAAALAARGDASPGELRAQVTSPNGTTAAGLSVLDGGGALSALLEGTVAAAARRSRELASAATPAAPGSTGDPSRE